MQQHIQPTLRTVAHENSTNAYNLSAQMIQLAVVQGAVAQLMYKIDEITHKGWHEDRGMACVSILEIQDIVRLIDMAFRPLFKEMLQDVDTLNIHAKDLYQTVIKMNQSNQVKQLINLISSVRKVGTLLPLKAT